MPFKVFFVVQHFCQDRQSFCFTFIYMLDYSEHYGTPWGPVIDGGGARVVGVGGGGGGQVCGRAWEVRCLADDPSRCLRRTPAIQWAMLVQDGVTRCNKGGGDKKRKKKKKGVLCREYYANLTRGQARGVSTGKRMILEIQTKKKHFNNNYTCRLRCS